MLSEDYVTIMLQDNGSSKLLRKCNFDAQVAHIATVSDIITLISDLCRK